RIDNVFNNTVRLLTYNPKIQDTLSKLIKGDLSLEYARSMVDPTYKAKLVPTPSPTPTIEPEITPETTPTGEPETNEPTVLIPEETPTVEPEPSEPTVSVPEETPTVEPEFSIESPSLVSPKDAPAPKIEVTAQPSKVESTSTLQPEVELSPVLVPQEKPAVVEPSISAEQSASTKIETPAADEKRPLAKPQWLDRILNRFGN
ncbi:MAG: hypothetical protein MUD14_29825, partial [Hydrococcus sp. Prado102]|nr:hypothetical protein [Hydrococcus sp. Prado102]